MQARDEQNSHPARRVAAKGETAPLARQGTITGGPAAGLWPLLAFFPLFLGGLDEVVRSGLPGCAGVSNLSTG
jgi:hypothetical protein